MAVDRPSPAAFDPKALTDKVMQAIKHQLGDYLDKQGNPAAESIDKLAKSMRSSMRPATPVYQPQTVTIQLPDQSKNKASTEQSLQQLATRLQPVDLAKYDIATEGTQSKVVDSLKKLNKDVIEMTPDWNGIYSMDTKQQAALVNALKQVENNTSKISDLAADINLVKTNTSLLDSVAQLDTHIADTGLRTLKEARDTNTALSELGYKLDFGNKQMDYYLQQLQTQALRNSAADGSGIPQMQTPAEPTLFQKALAAITEKFDEKFPPGSVVNKAAEVTGNMALFYGAVGGLAGAGTMWVLKKAIPFVFGAPARLMMKGLSLLTTFLMGSGSLFAKVAGYGLAAATRATGVFASIGLPGVSRLASFILGSTKIMGGVAALLSSAMIASMINDPEILTRYLTAFADIWHKVIVPNFFGVLDKFKAVFGRIAEDLVAWWYDNGESSFIKLGDILNYITLFLLEKSIPAAFNGIADILGEFVNAIGGVTSAILGIFGIGKDAPDGIWANINKIVNSIATALLNSVDILITSVIGMFGASNLFGLVGDETFFQRMKRGFTEIGDWVIVKITEIKDGTINWMTGVGDWISLKMTEIKDSTIGWVTNKVNEMIAFIQELNPLPVIKDKFREMVAYITDWIPTVEDLKAIIKDIVPERLYKYLFDDETATAIPQSPLNPLNPQTTPKEGRIAPPRDKGVPEPFYERFGRTKPLTMSPNINIIDNSTKSNTNMSTPQQGGMSSRPRGRPVTAPNMSPWENKVYKAP